MLDKKLNLAAKSKLSQTLDQMSQGTIVEKTGFIKKTSKSQLFKTKSFRLRETDISNLSNIANTINALDNRMYFHDSQIIRGIVNYISDNLDTHKTKLLPYINSSS